MRRQPQPQRLLHGWLRYGRREGVVWLPSVGKTACVGRCVGKAPNSYLGWCCWGVFCVGLCFFAPLGSWLEQLPAAAYGVDSMDPIRIVTCWAAWSGGR